MVFRRDSKSGDAFQRQISALRQQLGSDAAEGEADDAEETAPRAAESTYTAFAASAAAGTSELAGVAPGQTDDEAFDGTGGAMEGSAVTGEIVPTAPPMPEIPEVDAQTTVIAHGTTWKGEVSSEGTIHVHGRFEGSIRARDDVFVAEGADVDATVNAERVTIAGLIKGTIRCGARFEVLPTGRVTGDIQSPKLVIHEGATATGQFRMGAGEESAGEERPTPVVQRRAARGSA
jgi:cytoskeletal protein CcmA (bactofilin family)